MSTISYLFLSYGAWKNLTFSTPPKLYTFGNSFPEVRGLWAEENMDLSSQLQMSGPEISHVMKIMSSNCGSRTGPGMIMCFADQMERKLLPSQGTLSIRIFSSVRESPESVNLAIGE